MDNTRLLHKQLRQRATIEWFWKNGIGDTEIEWEGVNDSLTKHMEFTIQLDHTPCEYTIKGIASLAFEKPIDLRLYKEGSSQYLRIESDNLEDFIRDFGKPEAQKELRQVFEELDRLSELQNSIGDIIDELRGSAIPAIARKDIDSIYGVNRALEVMSIRVKSILS
jgi:hypothetical protein